MKKISIIVLMITAILIASAACAPAPTATPVPPTAVPPTAVPATKAPEPTKAPTVAPTAIPPTLAPTLAPTLVPPTLVPPTTVPTVAAPKPADASTLLAIKVTTAPKLDALADDAAWKTAPELKVSAAGGKNFKDGSGSTTATLKAVYTSDTIYFLLQYDDPTLSARRLPFVKQVDGSWKKLLDPDDPTNTDNNKYYEDKVAMIWTINNSIKGFDTTGCFSVCHAGEPNKPYGNKYTATPGELGDIWHWKSVRTGSVGQIDDQFLDDTRWDKDKAANAGRKSDPHTAGGYSDIALKDGKPEFMSKDAKPANAGGTYWLKDSDKVAFDDSKFKPGDEVASILVAPQTGDAGDIPDVSLWKDGKWTIAFSRKLTTDSKNTDVQFDKLDGTYYFGIAFFDNAQVRHAFNNGALKLQFAK